MTRLLWSIFFPFFAFSFFPIRPSSDHPRITPAVGLQPVRLRECGISTQSTSKLSLLRPQPQLGDRIERRTENSNDLARQKGRQAADCPLTFACGARFQPVERRLRLQTCIATFFLPLPHRKHTRVGLSSLSSVAPPQCSVVKESKLTKQPDNHHAATSHRNVSSDRKPNGTAGERGQTD